MTNNSQELSPDSPSALESHCEEVGNDRRWFLSTATVIMTGGLAGGYGTFFAMAGRFFFPSGANRQWIFVSNAEGIAPGESFSFQSPGGVDVMITRRDDSSGADDSDAGGSSEEASGEPVLVDSFLALSSVCPHLGCRVHWEANNNRFFCPCHNGVFDAEGVATAGPPAAEGQSLPHYTLQIVGGALYIEMPIPSIRRPTIGRPT